MDYSNFPPVVNQDAGGVSDEQQMSLLISDLMAGRKKKEFKGVGQALIGSLLNVVGSGLNAVGISGTKDMGTELLGQEDHNKTKDLSYLLAHLMSTQTARKQIDAETKRHVETLKNTKEIQDAMRASQEKIAEMQAKLTEQATLVKAASDKYHADITAGATVKGAELNADAHKSQTAAMASEGEKDRQSREKIAFTKDAMPSPQEQKAELIAKSLGTRLSSVAKNTKDAGSGIVQQTIDLATDPNVAAVYQQAQGKMSFLQAIDAVHGKDAVTNQVRDYIRQQGSSADPGILSFGMNKAQQRVQQDIENFVKTDPGLSTEPQLIPAYRAAANAYSGIISRAGADVNTVYSSELKNYTESKKYIDSINLHLGRLYSGMDNRISLDVQSVINGPKGTEAKYAALKDKVLKGVDEFSPAKSKAAFDTMVSTINSDPAFSWYARSLPQLNK